MEKITSPIVDRRKLITAGSSVVISIPKKWLDNHGLVVGDELLMIANGDLVFQKMTKENMEKVNKKLSQITNQTYSGVSQDSVTSNHDTPEGTLPLAETENLEK